MKKIIVILIVLSMLLTLILPIIANAQPEDVFLSSGKILEKLYILSGNSDGDLMLEDNLKRQDMVVLISRLYKEENKAKIYLLKSKFTDLSYGYEFYQRYVGWAVYKGLIKGIDDTTFGVDQNVTVQQFMAVLLRVLGYEEESNSWNTIPDLVVKLGIMEGLENNPKSDLTRGQMAVMTINALKLTNKGSTLTLADKLNLELN